MAETKYLRPMKASRRRPTPGDVFVMNLVNGRYLYGRVILADRPRNVAPMPGSNLIQVYDTLTDEPVLDAPLGPERLLIAPLFINRLPWTVGLFATIASRPLLETDRLRRYCFRRWTGAFLDENGDQLAQRSEPCGEWSLASYGVLDSAIGEALGHLATT